MKFNISFIGLLDEDDSMDARNSQIVVEQNKSDSSSDVSHLKSASPSIVSIDAESKSQPKMVRASSTPTMGASFLAASEKLSPTRSQLIPLNDSPDTRMAAAPASASSSSSSGEQSLSSESKFAQVREIIIADLLSQNEIDRKNAQAFQRAIDHVMCETVEVLSWIPKLNKSSAVQSEAVVVIHYVHQLFQTMYKAVCEAATSGYLARNAIHLNKLPADKPEKKYKKNSVRKFLDESCRELNLTGATVYIPICYGASNHLTGEELQQLVNGYLAKDVAAVNIYLGEYNSIDYSLDKVKQVGKEKMRNWFDSNQALIELTKSNAKVCVITRSKLVLEPVYQQASQFFEKNLLELDLSVISSSGIAKSGISKVIMHDALRYITGKTGKTKTVSPKFAPTPRQERDILNEISLTAEVAEMLEVPRDDSQHDPVVTRVLQRVEESKDDEVLSRLARFTAGYVSSMNQHRLFAQASIAASASAEQSKRYMPSSQGAKKR